MKYTNNYNLRKPEGNDKIDVDDFNYNIDAIDQLLKPSINDGKAPASNSEKLADTLSGMANRIKSITGNISWTDEPALNLKQVKEASNTLVTLLEDVKNHSNQLESPKYSNNITTKAAVIKIDTDTRKQLKITGVKGRTVVNLLGNDGTCTDVVPFTSGFNAKLSIHDGLKVVNNGDSNGTDLVGTAWKDISNLTQTNKYYCLSGYSKIIDANNCVINMYEQGTSNQAKYPKLNTSKTYTYWYGKIQRKDISKKLILELGVTGGKDKSAVFKNIMLNEISEAEYNDANYQPPPFMINETSVVNPEFKCVGKNLINIKSFSQYGTLGKLNNNTISYSVADSKYYPIWFDFTCANKMYKLTLSNLPNNCRIEIERFTTSIPSIEGRYDYLHSSQNTIDIDCTNGVIKCLRIKMQNTTDGTTFNNGNFAISNIQLEEGTTATTYEPYKETKAKIPYVLRSLSEAVYDEVDKNGILTKRIEKVVLDGSLNWEINSNNTGFKSVSVLLYNNGTTTINGSGVLYKYNNKKIKSWGDVTISADLQSLYGDRIYISISNADSGWGDSYTPTADEIKSYFYGYQMGYLDGNIFKTPYNGTGTKVFRNIIGDSGTGSATIPTSQSPYATPYRLYYQLSIPQQLDLNLPNLVAETQGSFVISSDYGVTPETSYQLADNLKANVDDLMVQVAKDREYLNNTMAEQHIQWIKPILLNGWKHTDIPLYYSKTKEGSLIFKGAIYGGKTDKDTVIMNLNPQYRPSETRILSLGSLDNNVPYLSNLTISANGDISCLWNVKNPWVNFDNVLVPLK